MGFAAHSYCRHCLVLVVTFSYQCCCYGSGCCYCYVTWNDDIDVSLLLRFAIVVLRYCCASLLLLAFLYLSCYVFFCLFIVGCCDCCGSSPPVPWCISAWVVVHPPARNHSSAGPEIEAGGLVHIHQVVPLESHFGMPRWINSWSGAVHHSAALGQLRLYLRNDCNWEVIGRNT